jgi:2-polyprenyl-3-methyl-5-hydroxy-6-metoxy-1,4-benzoquinol methylase
MKPSKIFLLNELENYCARHGYRVAILELGCGTAPQLGPFVRAHRDITYVGIEPSAAAAAEAKSTLGIRDNITVAQALAYEVPEQYREAFDIVVSMSVLEHVKDIKTFLRLSVSCAKKGGTIIHLYDLGHALYPSGIKERVQVALCGNPLTRWLISEQKIAQYVRLSEVTRCLEEAGATIDGVTYHNARAHVAQIKSNPLSSRADVLAIAKAEVEEAARIPDDAERERRFPSVCVWARAKKDSPR